MSAHTNDHAAAGQTHHHILPLKVYLGVGAALLVLTAITVGISYFHFGAFNLLVAMMVAAVKATLVALYFMHLKYDNKLYLFIFVSSVLFVAVFVIVTMFDTLRRGEASVEERGPIHQQAAMYDSLRTSGHGGEHSGEAADSLTVAIDSAHAADSAAAPGGGH